MKKRREYSAEYKTKIVLEALREEKSISEIASREGINPNQIGNWRREFLGNAALVFNRSKREEEISEKLKEAKEKEREYQAKVGQLTLEIDWLKKKSDEVLGEGWESRTGGKR
jgi:Transposase and inactivated derivatives